MIRGSTIYNIILQDYIYCIHLYHIQAPSSFDWNIIVFRCHYNVRRGGLLVGEYYILYLYTTYVRQAIRIICAASDLKINVKNHCPHETIYGRNNVVLHSRVYKTYACIYIVRTRRFYMNDNMCFGRQRAVYHIMYFVLPVKDISAALAAVRLLMLLLLLLYTSTYHTSTTAPGSELAFFFTLFVSTLSFRRHMYYIIVLYTSLYTCLPI